MNEFLLSKFAEKEDKLLKKAKDIFESMSLSTKDFPDTAADDGNIKLVFIGQYSAGKSSIIKMLTGEDVAVGAQITTQQAQRFLWNGIEVVDTPGIHTELRLDHDELTYEQINKASLLVFVISNEGFSQRIGEHFRKLAIDQKRAANMILVVNKMDRTALGNVPEQQKIIADDLVKVTSPYDPQKDLYLSFLDTSSYFSAVEEFEDKEIRQELLELSGYDIFVEHLNLFVADHELLGKAMQPLYTLSENIRKELEKNDVEGDKDVVALKDSFRQRKQKLSNGKNMCKKNARDIALEGRDLIVRKGVETSDTIIAMLEDGKGEADVRNNLTVAQHEIERIIINYAGKLAQSVKDAITDTNEELCEYEESAFIKNLNTNVKLRISQADSDDVTAFMHALGEQGIGDAIIANFGDPNAKAVGNIPQFAQIGGNLVDDLVGQFAPGLVKTGPQGIGGWVMNLFRSEPTMLEKGAAFFARNAGKIVGVGGVIVGAWMQHQAGKKAEENERKKGEIKHDICTQFNQVAEDFYKKIMEDIEAYADNFWQPAITLCDDKIKQVEDAAERVKKIEKKLHELLDETALLMDEIQAAK